jgi:hypothetical protein
LFAKLADKGCAFAAGAIVLKINQWIEERFNLPPPHLPEPVSLRRKIKARLIAATAAYESN